MPLKVTFLEYGRFWVYLDNGCWKLNPVSTKIPTNLSDIKKLVGLCYLEIYMGGAIYYQKQGQNHLWILVQSPPYIGDCLKFSLKTFFELGFSWKNVFSIKVSYTRTKVRFEAVFYSANKVYTGTLMASFLRLVCRKKTGHSAQILIIWVKTQTC